MFRLFKKKEEAKQETTIIVHNCLLDIRIGRKYARGDSMNGNNYECLSTTAEEVYSRALASSDDLKNVNKECFIEGYNTQAQELAIILK